MTKERIPILSITKKDFDLLWFSGTGPGGQNRNKNQNCVRLRHRETGFEEVGQSHRQRSQNLRDAFRRLAPRLVEHYVGKEKRARYQTEELVRTYHEPDNRVVDALSRHQLSYKEVVDKDGLGEMIEARARASLDEQIKKVFGDVEKK